MNTETFTPENKTISQIFNCDQIYRIPNYQRQYSWTNEQLEVLWDDLYEGYENRENNKCYFLGSIVVVKTGDYLDLIDGQQRITTLMIMMDVLRKNFSDINKETEAINFVDLEKINSCILHSGRRSRLQLQSDPNYDAIFNNKIIKREDYKKVSQPTKVEMNTDNPEHKYINTAYFFYNKFKELSAEDLNEFVNYIFFRTNIIKIVCTDESFAIKLFQVLNDRGLDLSNADLVKAEIFGKYESDDEDGKKSFNVQWNNIIKTTNEYELKMDDFLVYYEYFKLKSNPKKQLLDEIKGVIKGVNPKDVMEEMTEFSSSLETVCKSTDKHIYSLKYIPWKAYVNTALSCAYYVEYPDMERLLFAMRRFFYICFVSGGTLNTIKQTSFKLIENIVNKKSIDSIEKELNLFISSKRMIKKVYENLDSEVFDEKYLKPLLLSLDYDIREKTNTTFYKIDKELHMDHILPRAYKKNKDWKYIENREEADSLLNTLGNMALLYYTKNEECENFGFDTKIRIYQGLKEDGSNNGGITSYETTRIIIDNAKKEAEKRRKENNTDKLEYLWTTDNIKARKQYLMGLIENMLDITRDDVDKLIVVEELPNSLQKWEYKGEYYKNKEIILKLLTDYIESNEFKNFDEIHEDIRNLWMHSHLLIKEQLDENDITMGYSYYETEINNIHFYIRDFGDLEDTQKFINVLNKYYTFEIEYLGEEKNDSRVSITEDIISTVYDLSKEIYKGNKIKQRAIEELVDKGMNAGSAHIYITCFERMMRGETYKRYPTIYATEYFIENIRNDFGEEYYKNAIKAFEGNIEYLQSISKASKSYIELYEKYKQRI